jgi:hypothetical protein
MCKTPITHVVITFPNGNRPYVNFHRGGKVTTSSTRISTARAELITDLARTRFDFCAPMVFANDKGKSNGFIFLGWYTYPKAE